MSARVVLHIGTMKSGTSFIQSVLGAHQGELADRGCIFLGGKFGAQSRAVRDIYRLPVRPRRNRRRWARLAAEARALDTGVAVVSMEFLSFAREPSVREFLEPLQGLDVRVLLTVRDQFRAIPAQWQTYTRNFGTDDWSAYLRAIQAPRLPGTRATRAHSTFHRAQDVVPMLQRWGRAVGESAVDVVTVPGPDAPRDELWRRFATAAGIPEDAVDLSRSRANPSLGFASCDYLRRLNAHLGDVAPRRYRKAVRPLASQVLLALRDDEGRPELDARAAAYARKLNLRIRQAVTSGGYALLGDLDDLPVPESLAGFPERAPEPPVEQVRRAAAAAWTDAAARLGLDADEPPGGLDELVADGARLLRLAQGW